MALGLKPDPALGMDPDPTLKMDPDQACVCNLNPALSMNLFFLFICLTSLSLSLHGIMQQAEI